MTIDLNKDPNSRITKLKILCGDCFTPKFEDVVPVKNYTVIAPSYLANGGDGFKMLQDQKLDQFVGTVFALNTTTTTTTTTTTR